MSGLGPYGFPLFSPEHVAAIEAATAAGSGKGKDKSKDKGSEGSIFGRANPAPTAAADARSSPYDGKGVGKGSSFDGDVGGFSDGKSRFGQMCKKQHLHGDQIEELQRVVLLQTQKLKEQALKIEAQEQRLEQQERKMTWLLQQLDRTLPLPVGGEEPSEH
jgi:hypothetical protein